MEEIVSVLSSIKNTRETFIILAEDTNIDLTSCSTTLDVYDQMLDTYKLSCHVTEPNRKEKKVIDYISNIN